MPVKAMHCNPRILNKRPIGARLMLSNPSVDYLVHLGTVHLPPNFKISRSLFFSLLFFPFSPSSVEVYIPCKHLTGAPLRWLAEGYS
jgi:hypothetical protein